MFCSNCGKALSERDKFCSTCGARVEVKTQEPVIIPDPVIPCAEVAPKKKRMSVKKLLLAVVLPMVLVVLVAVILLILFAGKKTVYLCTETVNKNSMSATNITNVTNSYEFDEDGRVIAYEYKVKHQDSVTASYEISHTYDRKGRLVETEFELYGEELCAEYVYDGNTLVDIVFDDLPESYDEDDIELELDRNGNILFIALGDRDANVLSWEFSYHENGIVECAEHTNSITGRETVKDFDENGILRVMEDEIPGQYRIAYEYDEQGNLVLMEQCDGDGNPTMLIECTRVMEEDLLEEFAFTLKVPEQNGELVEAELILACEWDGLECTMTFDDIETSTDVDADMMEEAKTFFEELDLEICMEVDEAGNLLSFEMLTMGFEVISISKEYQEYKVPRSFVPDHLNNPIYLYFLGEL